MNEESFELKHINRKKKCSACEKMYRFEIEQLKKQNKLLIEIIKDEDLYKKLTWPIPSFDDIKIGDSCISYLGHERSKVDNVCIHCHAKM